MKDALNIFHVTARAKINDNNWKVEGSRFWLKTLPINTATSKIRLGFFRQSYNHQTSQDIFTNKIECYHGRILHTD